MRKNNNTTTSIETDVVENAEENGGMKILNKKIEKLEKKIRWRLLNFREEL